MNVSKSRQELADDAVQAQFEDSVRRLGEKATAPALVAAGDAAPVEGKEADR